VRVMTSPRSTDPGFVAAVATTTACTTNAQNSGAPLSLQEGRAETAGADAGHARTSIALCLQPARQPMPGEEEEHRQPHRIATHTNACADARATRKRTPNGTDRAFRVAARICACFDLTERGAATAAPPA